MTVRELFVTLGFNVDNASYQKAEGAVSSLKSMAVKALGAIGIGFGLSRLNAIAEQYNDINDKIAYATKGLGEQSVIQQSILDAANATKTSYGDMAGTVTRLVQLNKDLFPVDEAVEFATITQKLLVTAGKSGEEASSVQRVLSRVFQIGKVNSGVLRNLFNTAPEIINTLSESLGVAKERLYDLADRGVLTGKKIKEAILGASDKINEGYSELDISISDALLSVRNSWGAIVDDFNQSLQLTDTIAKGILKISNVFLEGAKKVKEFMAWLADKVGGTENMLKLLAIGLATLWAVFNADKIIKVLQTISTALGAINLKTLAITAGLLLLALLVEDFISFLNGKDSLFGTLLEEAGLDVDEVRESILKAFDDIKTSLDELVRAIQGTSEGLGQWFEEFWAEHGEWITETFGSTWDSIVRIFQSAYAIIEQITTTVGGWLQAFWDKWGGTITAFIDTSLQMIITIFNSMLQSIADAWEIFAAIFEGDWDKVWELLGKKLSNELENIGQLWNEWTSGFGNVWNEFWEACGDDIMGFVDSILAPFNAMIEFFTNLKDEALGWGKDIIQNITDGIFGSQDNLFTKIEDIAQGVADFLGFSEPKEGPLSKFHTFMPDMIKLMVDGLNAGEGKLRKAFESLSGNIEVMARATLVSGGTAAMAVPNNTYNRNVVQYNSFTNTFNGDRVGQTRSADAMETAAEDAISYMARAMYYGG